MARTLPNTPEILPIVAKAVMDDEDRTAEALPTTPVTTIASEYVGFVRLERGKDVLYVEVHLGDDDWWVARHGPQQANSLLASLIKTNTGKIFIVINETLRIASTKREFRQIVEGILAHEVGHYLAGHLAWKMGPKVVDTLPEIEEARVIPPAGTDALPFYTHHTTALLAGGTFDMEYEADRYAAGLVGMGSVLAMLADEMAAADRLFVRLEFQNRIERHCDDLRKGTSYPTARIKMKWYIFTDEELDEIRKEEEEKKKAASGDEVVREIPN